jgi:hypothetical protein
LGVRGILLAKVGVPPGKVIDRRLVAAIAIKRFLHRYADAVVIDSDIVGTVADARNSIHATSHVTLHNVPQGPGVSLPIYWASKISVRAGALCYLAVGGRAKPYPDCGMREVDPLADVPRTNPIPRFEPVECGRKTADPENAPDDGKNDLVFARVCHPVPVAPERMGKAVSPAGRTGSTSAIGVAPPG